MAESTPPSTSRYSACSHVCGPGVLAPHPDLAMLRRGHSPSAPSWLTDRPRVVVEPAHLYPTPCPFQAVLVDLLYVFAVEVTRPAGCWSSRLWLGHVVHVEVLTGSS